MELKYSMYLNAISVHVNVKDAYLQILFCSQCIMSFAQLLCFNNNNE